MNQDSSMLRPHVWLCVQYQYSQYTYLRKKKRIITKYIMKPCIHSAGKRTLHPNSTLLCHVHFLSSVLSCRVFTFKVFLVISDPDKRGYVHSLFCMAGFVWHFWWREKLLSFPNYKSIEAKYKQNEELNNSPKNL